MDWVAPGAESGYAGVRIRGLAGLSFTRIARPPVCNPPPHQTQYGADCPRITPPAMGYSESVVRRAGSATSIAMLTDVKRLLNDAWTVVRTAPLLWLAILLPSAVPPLSGSSILRLVDCMVTPVRLLLSLIAAAAIPFLVVQAHRGLRPPVADVTPVVKSALPQLLGLYAIATLLLAAPLLIATYLVLGPDPVTPSPFAVLLGKLLVVPVLGAFTSIAIAGISLDRLNALKALANAVLIGTNNLLVIAPLALTLSVVTLVLRTLLVALEFSPELAIQDLVLVFPSTPQLPTAWQQALHWVAYALLLLPVSTYGSAIWVLLYTSATAKVAYPWIARNRPA